MGCWSPEQVRACRIREIVSNFENKHLPWCVFEAPYSKSSCNCHNLNRTEYLEHYAESVINAQDATNTQGASNAI